MDLGLEHKVMLVTDGTSAIGMAIAQRALEEGARIAITGSDADKLRDAEARLRKPGRDVMGIPFDVGQPHQAADIVARISGRFQRIDIVVSNAGSAIQGEVEDIPVERLEACLRVGILGPWELARQIAPHMRRQGGGRFILVIDQAGKVPGRNVIASALTNAAQHAFVKSLSDDFGRDKILVNAVCPSHITGSVAADFRPNDPLYLGRSLEQQESGWGGEVPLGHWGDPQDVADAVVFLASERAGYICGSNIDVDGGYQRSIF